MTADTASLTIRLPEADCPGTAIKDAIEAAGPGATGTVAIDETDFLGTATHEYQFRPATDRERNNQGLSMGSIMVTLHDPGIPELWFELGEHAQFMDRMTAFDREFMASRCLRVEGPK